MLDHHIRNRIAVIPAGGDGAVPFSPPATAEGSGIDIGLLARTFLRRLYIVILLAILGAGLGIVAQSKLTPRYTSFVSILLDPKRTDSFGAEGPFATVQVDAAKIASVAYIIESSELLGRVVKSLHLGDDPEFGDQQQSRLHKWFGFLPFMKAPPSRNDPETRAERALAQLKKAVRVDRDGYTYALTIGVSADGPEKAQMLTAAVAKAYLDDQLSIKMEATRRDSAWLTDQLHEASQQLAHSEEDVEAIRRKFGFLETEHGAEVTSAQQLLQELNTQLAQAQADVATRKVRYEQAQRLRASGGNNLEGLTEVAASRVISELRSQQNDVATKLHDLESRYNDAYPEVRRLRDVREALQKQVDAEVARIVDGLRNEYETAVARAQSLSQRLQETSSAASGADTAEGRVRLDDAERAVDANRQLYQSILGRLRDVKQQQTREEPEARILSQADLPERPSWPKPFLLPTASTAVFLFLGLVLTVGPALFDSRFASVKDVERRLGVLVLGAIPLLRRRDLGFARRRVTIFDYATRRPLSHFAESLRMVRAYLRVAADGSPSVVQVTSAVPGEGKSTVAAALAASAALAGIRTALVDVDLRTASLSGMFGLRHEEGLREILEFGVPFQTVARDVEGLTVIGTGFARMPRPDAINSGRFEALMRELAANYTLVIIDSPPALAVSDALVISRYADATILVVQWRATARALVTRAVKMLQTVDAPLVGVILNKIDLSKVSRYEYGNQYYDKRGYGGSKMVAGRRHGPEVELIPAAAGADLRGGPK
jgi:succinoglycan biosynthesis transport protein ExoP